MGETNCSERKNKTNKDKLNDKRSYFAITWYSFISVLQLFLGAYLC